MDQIETCVVPYSACAAEVIAFRNANRLIQRDAAYFRWRYEARPCRTPASIVWARLGGQAVGAASLIPREFHVVDCVVPVGLVGDISVMPQVRGHGIAEKMLSRLNESVAAKALGGSLVLPNAQVTGPLTRAGWSPARPILRLVRVLDYRGPLQRRLGRIGGLAGLVANIVLRPSRKRSGTGRPDVLLREPATFDTRYDTLWGECQKAGGILAVRDRANLAWRFAEYPGQAFGVIEVTGSTGLVAYAVYHRVHDALMIDDYLSREYAVLPALAEAIVALARDRRLGVDIHVRCAVEADEIQLWGASGFRPRGDRQIVMAGGGLLRPHARWHLTAADKDV